MLKNNKILINFIKAIYLAAIFVAACLCFSHFLSQGNVDMTMEMQAPVFPVIHLNIGDRNVNYLYGYAESMNTAFMRDTLTVVDADRRIDFCIETFGTEVDDIRFEVRSIDGSRLVESTGIHAGSPDDEGCIEGNFTIKDLITRGDEYMLVFVLAIPDDREIRYYTRLMYSEDVHVNEKIEYVYDFSDRTFDRNRASELTKYLESDSTGDNSSFMYTDIHSSFKQVTWGTLNVTRIGEPRITVSELTAATGYFRVDYQVGIAEESGLAVCNVSEYFRIRYTPDRIYLLSWERYLSQIPDETRDIYADTEIELGLAGGDIDIVESDGGNVFAFVQEGKLLSVNLSEQKVIRVYSFYGEDLTDLRCAHAEHRIRILNVDENGDVGFAVYGYMNRGIHEGHVGLAVYNYNSAVNTYEEKAFVGYNGSASVLMNSIDELLYADRDGDVFFMLERDVYEIDMSDNVITEVASSLSDDAYRISGSGQMLLWQTEGDVYSCTKLRLLNLSTGLSEDIKAGYGEYIMPIGFMNDDMVFGLAKSRDVVTDIDGSVVFPMYKLIIRDDAGEILKSYSEEGVYVMDCTFEEDLMNLTRSVYSEETGSYVATTDDQIVSTAEPPALSNRVTPVVTEALETVIQISMKSELTDEEIVRMDPRQIMYEGGREFSGQKPETAGHYYVYGLHGFMDSYVEVSNAVNRAYDLAGIVVDDRGQCIWYRTARVSRNQIMAITAPEETAPEDSLAVCIDAVLRFEGTTTNSKILLAQGHNVQEILTDYLNEYVVFNLTGCNLDSVLYYVNRDIPVLAVMKDSTAMLITGFNETEVVLFDPVKGELRKENFTDVDNLLKTNGYRFITYIK